jgi:hypothetical protein
VPSAEAQSPYLRAGNAFHADAINPHWSRNVFKRLLAQILESEAEPSRRILLHASRYTNATGLRQAFEPSRDVDAIAEDVGSRRLPRSGIAFRLQ